MVREPIGCVEPEAGVHFLHLHIVSKWRWKQYNWTYLFYYEGILRRASVHVVSEALRNVKVVVTQAMCRFLGKNESVGSIVGIKENLPCSVYIEAL